MQKLYVFKNVYFILRIISRHIVQLMKNFPFSFPTIIAPYYR